MYEEFLNIISKELEEFEKQLLVGTAKDAVEHAYELVIKRELVNFFESHEEQALHWVNENVLKIPQLLDWIYYVWLKYDRSIQESFADFTGYLISYVPTTSVF